MRNKSLISAWFPDGRSTLDIKRLFGIWTRELGGTTSTLALLLWLPAWEEMSEAILLSIWSSVDGGGWSFPVQGWTAKAYCLWRADIVDYI